MVCRFTVNAQWHHVMALWIRLEMLNVKYNPNSEFLKGAVIYWVAAHRLMMLQNITGDMWVVAIFLGKTFFNHCCGSRTELSPNKRVAACAFLMTLWDAHFEICILLSAGWRIPTNFIEVDKHLLDVEDFEDFQSILLAWPNLELVIKRWQALSSFAVWSTVLSWHLSAWIICYDSGALGSYARFKPTPLKMALNYIVLFDPSCTPLALVPKVVR